MNDYLNLFTKYHPDFIGKLDLFTGEKKRSLLRKLKNSSNETDFLSLVSEINFGLLFKELSFELQHEKKTLGLKTPDWTISLGDKIAICEVYRLGKSETDQKLADFENLLKRGFEKIEQGYIIKYSFVDDIINRDNLSVEVIISELSNWLFTSKTAGEKVTIEDVTFEILSPNKNSKLAYVSGSKPIDYRIQKLVQHDSLQYDNMVTKKLIKYSEAVSKLGVPYFVCIESDLLNGFYFDEFSSYFRGSFCMSCEYDYLGEREIEIEYSKLGSLYHHPNVSGIIVKIGEVYRKILNPLKTQFLYNIENTEILKKINEIPTADILTSKNNCITNK